MTLSLIKMLPIDHLQRLNCLYILCRKNESLPCKESIAEIMKNLLYILLFVVLSMLWSCSKQSPHTEDKTIEVQTDTVTIVDTVHSVRTLPRLNSFSSKVIYRGIFNTLKLEGVDTSDEITITDLQAEKAAIEQKGNSYVINPELVGPLKVHYLVESDRFLDTITEVFTVKNIPTPTVKLGGRSSGGPIPSGILRVSQGLLASLPFEDSNLKCEVNLFELLLIQRRADPLRFINQGAAFNPQIKNALRKVRPRDLVIIRGIRCNCEGMLFRPNDMVFEIR